MSNELKEKFATENRPATRRELLLLSNVWAGRQRYALVDQRRLGQYSQEKLEESLKRA